MPKPPNHLNTDLQLAFAEEGQDLFDRLLEVRLNAIPNRTVKWQPRLERLSKDERRAAVQAAVAKAAASLGDRDIVQLKSYGLSSKNIAQLKTGDLRCGFKVYSFLPDDFTRISLVPGYLHRPLVEQMREQVEAMHGGLSLELIEERAAKSFDRFGWYPEPKRVMIPNPRAVEITPLDLQWLQPLANAKSALEAKAKDDEAQAQSTPSRREPHQTTRDRRYRGYAPRHK